MVSMQDLDPLRPPEPTAAAEAGDDYHVAETLGQQTPDVVDQERVQGLAQESQMPRRRPRLIFGGKRPSLPRLPMLAGVFNFPWQRGERLRWLCLSLALLLPLALASGAFAFDLLGLFYWPFGCTFALAWVAVAFSYAAAIVRDTAEGNRSVENWIDGPFFEGIGDCLYVINALTLSAIPALVLLVPGCLSGLECLLIVTLCLLLPFPVLLLSMFEADSPLVPVSPAVWRSMFAAWWAWGAFYAETAVLCLAVGWLLQATWLIGAWWALVPDAFLLVAAMMIYFRLLGRLGHCCADAARRYDPDEMEEFDDQPA